MTIAIKHTTDSETPDLSMIMRDIASLRDDLAGMARGLTKDASESLKDATEKLTVRGGRAAQAIGNQIEDQKLLSLAIAFGLGFLGSRLLTR